MNLFFHKANKANRDSLFCNFFTISVKGLKNFNDKTILFVNTKTNQIQGTLKMKPLYKRVLFKLSGEGLMGDKSFGMSPEVLHSLAGQIKSIHKSGVDVCIVVGGGNIFRGAKEAAKGMNRTVADQVGMLATLMNALCLQNALENQGVEVRVLSGLGVPQVCENYMYRKALRHLEKKRVIIFAGGTGNPYFTTDTGAVLRASEMQCEAVLKATQVDGVYTADPKKDKNAKRIKEISYDEVIQRQLGVMDLTAVSLAKENNMPILVFCQQEDKSMEKVIQGKGTFTIIKN